MFQAVVGPEGVMAMIEELFVEAAIGLLLRFREGAKHFRFISGNARMESPGAIRVSNEEEVGKAGEEVNSAGIKGLPLGGESLSRVQRESHFRTKLKAELEVHFLRSEGQGGGEMA